MDLDDLDDYEFPPPSRREKRARSRRAILDVAAQRLREGRFSELSVDQLMAEAKLSRTLFYQHFADLGDMVVDLLQDVGAPLVAVAERWAGDSTSAPIGRASLEAIVAFFAEHGPLVRGIADAARHDPEVERAWAQVDQRFVDITAGALARLPHAPADAHETARALTAMNEHYLLATFGRTPPTTDPERAVDALWTIWRRVIYPTSNEE